jgi:hypothetical protein
MPQFKGEESTYNHYSIDRPYVGYWIYPLINLYGTNYQNNRNGYLLYNDFYNDSNSEKMYTLNISALGTSGIPIRKTARGLDGFLYIGNPSNGLDHTKAFYETEAVSLAPPFIESPPKTIKLPPGFSRILFFTWNRATFSPTQKYPYGRNQPAIWISLREVATNKIVFKTDGCWSYADIGTPEKYATRNYF